MISSMATTDKRQIQLRVLPPLKDRIERFWHQRRFRSRHEAIVWLLVDSLDRHELPAEHPDQMALFATGGTP